MEEDYNREYLELLAHNSSRERIHASLIQKIADDRNEGKGYRIPILWQRMIAAASIVMVVGTLLCSYFYHQPITQTPKSTLAAINVNPGSNKAVLTLSTGQKVSLADADTGTVTSDGNVTITKSAEGQIIYNPNNTNAGHASNVIETPWGGEFQVILPDGLPLNRFKLL